MRQPTPTKQTKEARGANKDASGPQRDPRCLKSNLLCVHTLFHLFLLVSPPILAPSVSKSYVQVYRCILESTRYPSLGKYATTHSNTKKAPLKKRCMQPPGEKRKRKVATILKQVARKSKPWSHWCEPACQKEQYQQRCQFPRTHQCQKDGKKKAKKKQSRCAQESGSDTPAQSRSRRSGLA